MLPDELETSHGSEPNAAKSVSQLRVEFEAEVEKRKAAYEEHYGIELSMAEYYALQKATTELEPCVGCQSVYCNKWLAKARYLRPTIKIAGGKAIIGEERCPQWHFYTNELCDRAGIPRRYLGKGFDDYRQSEDNAEVIAMARWYVREYPTCGLYYYGGAGTGKTFLASIIAREIICAGRKVLFGDVPSLLKRIKERFDLENRVERDDNITAQMIIDKYTEVPVLVLDDIGAGYVTAWNVGVLYEIINDRYNLGLRTIVTSNFDLEGLRRRLNVRGAEYESERIVSRLMEMCEEGYFGTHDRRREARRYA